MKQKWFEDNRRYHYHGWAFLVSFCGEGQSTKIVSEIWILVLMSSKLCTFKKKKNQHRTGQSHSNQLSVFAPGKTPIILPKLGHNFRTLKNKFCSRFLKLFSVFLKDKRSTIMKLGDIW